MPWRRGIEAAGYTVHNPPWILLRGLTREAAHWGGFINAFADAQRGARVVAPDLPGNGVLHRAESPATVRGMVEACRAELAAQGVRPPFRVLAMSLGAMVATEWARQAPHEVQACVLMLPGVGEQAVPVRVRVAVAIALTPMLSGVFKPAPE